MRNLLLGCLALFSTISLKATEGMWIPSLLDALNEGDMTTMGMEISAEDIYAINRSSLKDAIARFGGGCTAELISDQGLLLTNHHCGYGQIQQHSSLENDYLKNGFWAMSKAEEIPNPGLTATFIERIEDVTAEILKGVTTEMGLEERQTIIAENIATLEAQWADSDFLQAQVKPFNYGNAYFVIVSKTYKDVRLVGAPPSAVGKFGGDTDNWVWPRHTGDFSMFRIYANQDNEPEEYNPDNKPFQPKEHLSISLDGVKEGDFTMVFGFPGRTEQYLPSYAVDYVMNTGNPMKIGMRDQSLEIINQAMRASDKTRIQYAAKQSRISNAWKKWKGQNMGLERNNALQVKKDLERDFMILNKKMHKDGNVEVLPKLEQLYKDWLPSMKTRDLYIEYFYYGPEVYRFTSAFISLIRNEQKLKEEGKWDGRLEGLQASIDGHFKDYDMSVDKAIFNALTPMFLENLPSEYSTNLLTKFNGASLEKLSDKLYKKSLFTSKEKAQKALEMIRSGNTKKLLKDPLYLMTSELDVLYWEDVRPSYSKYASQSEELMRLYVAGLMETFPDKDYWYDANSTLRLTYGKAEGSAPVDGMAYTFYTTADGILAKYQPGHPDFDLPEDLVVKLRQADWGIYGTDNELRVCLTGSNHTTGGNSGSPALNGKGQLIGLNFDRSWESTMSDIMFDPEICRNIMVDIKYVLWIVDKYAGARHLVDEMTLVQAKHEKAESDVAIPAVEH